MEGSRRVVIKPAEFLSGAPMERMPGVRDWKVIYPETGFPVKTLTMEIVEIDPGAHTPLHRHNCEEVYFVLQGRGYIESEGERYEFEAGDAIYHRENTAHRVFNTGAEPVRLCVVAGIMLMGLLPQWPTPSPYEILES